jgi:general secretion pathway protein A
MYCEFYGFQEKPFSVTPNPRFLFLSKHHREAFAHLLYGINNHVGFIELTGEVGTGKTTILRTLLEQLDDGSHRTALIFNPCLSALELLRSVNREFDLPSESLGTAELLEKLNQFLLNENRQGRTVVLAIDEAQHLEPQVLEQIRLISNLETDTDKLIQIVLAGQPELKRLLERPDLRQLAQRMTVRYHLLPLDREDTAAYIHHRILVAGGTANVVFSPAAIRAIFHYSQGSPRIINIACDRALLVAYTEGLRSISGKIARQAIGELAGPDLHRYRFTKGWTFAALTGLLVGGVAVLGMALVFRPSLRSSRNKPTTAAIHQQAKQTVARPAPEPVAYKQPTAPKKSVPPPPAAVSVTTSPATVPPQGLKQAVKPVAKPAGPTPALPPPQPHTVKPVDTPSIPAASAKPAELPSLLAKLPEGPEPAFNALAHLWNAPAVKSKEKWKSVEQLARQSGLALAPFNGTIAALQRLNTPAILEVKVPGRGTRYLTVTGIAKDRITIVPALPGKAALSRKELESQWSGHGYLLWKNHQNIPANLSPGSADVAAIRLQILLTGAGFFKSEPSGLFDDATRKALADYQKARGLKADGRPGAQTLLLLYRDGGKFPTPQLGAGSSGRKTR